MENLHGQSVNEKFLCIVTPNVIDYEKGSKKGPDSKGTGFSMGHENSPHDLYRTWNT